MKKLLYGLFTFIILLSFSFGQDWTFQKIGWGGGQAESDTVITTGADTTDWFRIPSGVRNKVKYPETLSFLCTAIQTSTTDASEVTFTLELSNDRTDIFAYGQLVDISQADVDRYSDRKILTDLPLFEFGRVIATGSLAGGDSIRMGVQLTRDFSNY